MNLKPFSLVSVSAIAIASVSWAASASALPTYHLAKEFSVAGEGSWDYLSIDSDTRRLYVSHGDRLEILNADTGAEIGAISDTPRVHGVAIASELGRGFTSNGGDSSVTIFDTGSLKTIKKVKVNRPDFILYDAFSHRVFPLNKDTSVLDAKTGDVVGRVDLGGSPEAAAPDGHGVLYVNLEDRNAIAVVDTKELKVIRTFPAECTEPHSLSYDAVNGRLLIGCATGFRVIDASTGKIVGSSTMCGGVDAGSFDPQTKLVFQSCAEGIVSVIRQISADSYELEQSVPTRLFAKTMTYDPKTRRIYLSTAEFDWPKGDVAAATQPLRPTIRPDSFRVLVLEP